MAPTTACPCTNHPADGYWYCATHDAGSVAQRWPAHLRPTPDRERGPYMIVYADTLLSPLGSKELTRLMQAFVGDESVVRFLTQRSQAMLARGEGNDNSAVRAFAMLDAPEFSGEVVN